MLLFPESGPKKNFRVTASQKTATQGARLGVLKNKQPTHTPESGSKKDFRVTASLKP
jgi:hypothetical protein